MPKALVLKDIGKISLEDRPVPLPREGEVLVRVIAAGICGSDIPRIFENGAHKMPIIPGHEFSGVVEMVGGNVSQHFVGKRVAVYPKIACGKCPLCLSGKPQLCRNYDYIGSRRDGAFAGFVTVPYENLMLIPRTVSFEEAAMFEPMAVAANSVRTAAGLLSAEHGKKPVQDVNIAVCGLGTIGLMTVMILKGIGCRNIFVIGNKDFQKEKAAGLGIPEENYCDEGKNDPVEWIMSKTVSGADIYFECVGKNECIAEGIRSAAPGGKVILVGNPYTDMNFGKDTYWKILRDQITLRGIWNSTFRAELNRDEVLDDWHYVMEKIVEGRLKPRDLITHRFDMSEIEIGLKLMRDKTDDYCKVMLTNPMPVPSGS